MKQYAKTIPGPSLDAPFRVLEGVVVVHLVGDQTLIVPPGGAWPGLEHLPEIMLAHLRPVHTSVLPGTRTVPDGEDGRSAALALITAQALTVVGVTSERIRFADAVGLDVRSGHRATAALVLGTKRESFTKVLGM